MIGIYLGILFFWNIIVFSLYGIDKQRAKKGQWRLSEKSLLLVTLLLGGIGAMLAGFYFHHKTRKWYFELAWYLGSALILGITYLIMIKLR